ncbi:MAG: aminopeptidase P family protein [Verrucomicrobiaceae bacterium]|nr:aminopeptidase P family protein [Verrucomicrobiaceae bacterium]
MRHSPIDSRLFVQNRQRLATLLPPRSIALFNANDIPVTNADGTLVPVPNADLFYLSGIEQEETVLLICPDAFDEKHREILFVREPNEHLKIWEGHKHSKDEAIRISGIKTVKWLHEMPTLLKSLVFDSENVFLNTNEHKRADTTVQTRDDRFILDMKHRFPLHQFRRVAPLMHKLRVEKSKIEIDLLKRAVQITKDGFERVARHTRPGVLEHELEAEFAHEFIRQRARFSYNPIIASGVNSCILHYNQNDQPCKKGDLLLLDVGASYANYSADLTRTIPVSGKFSRRQKEVYCAVLRVMRDSIARSTVGTLHRDWVKAAQMQMNEELLSLGLIKKSDIKKQTEETPACRKYFMHGLGHVLGIDVHDVGLMNEPFAPGWVLTVEPGIYIPEEGFGVRLENDIVVTENGPVDLMADIPVEPDEIEALMARK